MERLSKASAIIFNTFDELENPVLNAIKSILRTPIYTIGPSRLLANQIVSSSSVKSMGSNLWIEQPGCLEWLEGRDAQSVVYVNFGSITVLTNEQLVEFAWGLANSSYEFIWIIRPDLVRGNNAVLPPELLEKINDRSLLASWCPQEAVLRHKAIGAFLTHCGWNSVLESIYNGVPMLCWPFFADHPTICWCTCTKWEVGMEIDSVVKREEIERLIRKIMKGEEGKKMKEKAMEWKGSAIRATNPGGSSFVNFQRLLEEVLV
ncbi:hypothetical protein LUZ61_005934 [Rhynchospora tenuis]|uniref:UDP-glycosyltransferases domain-containing protein n=1 Tax=Rhynchospora tenuis TaxID=198213 RepID=A0AAD5ZQJ0_9POAL|nr:hypothetical protein LUZ61_005934 [Rhynchospora tenuis]